MKEKLSEMFLLFKRTFFVVVIIGLILTIFFSVVSLIFGFKDIDLSQENIITATAYNTIASILIYAYSVVPCYMLFLILKIFVFSHVEKNIKLSYFLIPVAAGIIIFYSNDFFFDVNIEGDRHLLITIVVQFILSFYLIFRDGKNSTDRNSKISSSISQQSLT